MYRDKPTNCSNNLLTETTTYFQTRSRWTVSSACIALGSSNPNLYPNPLNDLNGRITGWKIGSVSVKENWGRCSGSCRKSSLAISLRLALMAALTPLRSAAHKPTDQCDYQREREECDFPGGRFEKSIYYAKNQYARKKRKVWVPRSLIETEPTRPCLRANKVHSGRFQPPLM